jgi:hypothetical protein
MVVLKSVCACSTTGKNDIRARYWSSLPTVVERFGVESRLLGAFGLHFNSIKTFHILFTPFKSPSTTHAYSSGFAARTLCA